MSNSKILAVLFCCAVVFSFAGCGYLFPEQTKQNAVNLLNQYKPKQAIDLLSSVINANSKDKEAYLLRAAAYAYDHQPEKAVDDCSYVLSLDPKDSQALVTRGFSRLREEPPAVSLALSDFNKAIASDPRNAWPYLGRAMARYQGGLIGGAKDDVQLAVACNPQDGATCGVLMTELHLLDFREQYKLYDKKLKDVSYKQLEQLSNYVQRRTESTKQALRDRNPMVMPESPPSELLNTPKSFALAILANSVVTDIAEKKRAKGIESGKRKLEESYDRMEKDIREREQAGQDMRSVREQQVYYRQQVEKSLQEEKMHSERMLHR